MENGNARSVPPQGQELQTLVDDWAANYSSQDYDPLPFLTRVAQMLEEEMGRFLTTDPDPYDERCLVKTDKCALRYMHTVLYRTTEFFNRLVNHYICSGNEQVAIMCCRIMISFSTAVTLNVGISDNNVLVDRLYEWALDRADKDLAFFACYLIGVIMEVAEQVTIHKEKNFRLITVCLPRLHRLSHIMVETNRAVAAQTGINPAGDECSNSSWNGDPRLSNVGQYKFDTLTVELKQRLILKFLTPMAEYQDMLPLMLEGNAVQLVFTYLDSTITTDVRLVFEGLRFLTSLLCHKRISSHFIQSNGIQCMLTIPRPSVASTAISVNLYYMAYFEDAMELVCRLPLAVLEKIVDYALWLLECSHESGRCYILMFFSHAFSYKIILNLFDRRDGFRRLINVLSTQPVLREGDSENELHPPPRPLVLGDESEVEENGGEGEGVADAAVLAEFIGLGGGGGGGGGSGRNGSVDTRSLSDDTMYTSRQVIKLVSVVVCKYMEVQAILRGEQLAQEHPWAYGSQSPPANNDIALWKPIRYSTEQLHETLDVIFSLSRASMTWPPVDSFERLDCLCLFLRVLVLAAFEWRHYPGRTETVRNMIDSLAVCVAVPRMMDLLTNSQITAGGNTYEGVELMLLMTDNDKFLEPAAQRAALFLLSACVCRPLEGKKDAYLETKLRPPSAMVDRKRKLSADASYPPSIDVYLRRMWNTVRRHNGIMVLLRLLETRTPISDADAIRELACKALLGLSRDEAVNQMLARLPLFAKGTLQYLMKEPVLPDKQTEHNRFCRYAVHLIQRVCGQPLSNLPADLVSMEKLRRAEIVASTKIQWDEKELLALMHKHLLTKGLSRTAEILQREADLGHLVLPSPPSPPAIYQAESDPGAEKETPSTPGPVVQTSMTATPSSHHNTAIRFSLNAATPSSLNTSLSTPVVNPPPNPATPQSSHNLLHAVSRERGAPANLTNVFMQPARPAIAHSVLSSEQTLEKIIEGYLNQQHALCPHPVTTCPSFSLLRPHRCPDRRSKSPVSSNMTTRLIQRQVNPLLSHMDYMKEHRRFIFSRFKPHYVVRDSDGEHCTACCFSTLNDNLLYVGVGQIDGPNDIKVINLETEEMFSWTSVVNCSINHMCLSPDSEFLIACTMWSGPSICLWGLPKEMNEHNQLIPKIKIEEEGYAEFSKTSSSSIVVTRDMTATVMDVHSAEIVRTLFDSQKCNNYQRNRATFSYCDQLVLNDGVLWDLRTSKAIHKFDKLQNEFSGVFHPNRFEVLIGSAVWDVRTFGLSKNISALEGLETRFNSTGHVMYAGAFYWKDEFNSLDVDRSMRGIFRTLDSLDYGLIATIDLKRRLHCLALDSADRYLALIETTQTENVCRVYQVGRTKAPDEDDDADTEDGQDGGDEDHGDVSLDDDEMANLMELVANDDNEDDNDDDDDDDDISDMFAEFGDTGDSSDDDSDSSDDGSSSPDSGNESSTEEEDDEGYEESDGEAG